MQRPWPLAKANGFILAWEALTSNWYLYYCIISVDVPYSKVDTAPGNKKGSLLNYGR
jgi:hypothetical protein